MTSDDVIAALHELVAHCGHCGKRSCPGRRSHSTLPESVATDDVFRALEKAKRAAKKRRKCKEQTAWIKEAESKERGQ